MRFFHFSLRGLFHRRWETFEEYELPQRIRDILVDRMYRKYPKLSWRKISESYPDELLDEKARIRVELRRYPKPIRYCLRVITRWFPFVE